LKHPDGTPVAITGLWDLAFGGGKPANGRANDLYFDAGFTAADPAGNGLFGVIRAALDGGQPCTPQNQGGDPTGAIPQLALGLGSGGLQTAQPALLLGSEQGPGDRAGVSVVTGLLARPDAASLHDVWAPILLHHGRRLRDADGLTADWMTQ
jgi:hypothetical protein